jgi:hypothetical protein
VVDVRLRLKGGKQKDAAKKNNAESEEEREKECVGCLLLFARRIFIRRYNKTAKGAQVKKRPIRAKIASRDQAILVLCLFGGFEVFACGEELQESNAGGYDVVL